jgi:hypothetical protein
MIKYQIATGFILILLSFKVVSQDVKSGVSNSPDTAYCILQEELILYNLVSDYRRENKLAPIALSKNLSIVAVKHIEDLLKLKPQESGCSLHSWSESEHWKGCCYGKNPMDAQCMSSKPRELTSYTGNGYELIYWQDEKATPFDAYELWKQVPASRDILLNKGKWHSKTWKAIGVGVRNGYAIIWLGDKADDGANIFLCGSDSLIQTTSIVNIASILPPATGRIQKENNPISVTDDSGEILSGSRENAFYVIVASLRTESLAHDKVKELTKSGYDNAIILSMDGRFRISLGTFDSEEKAKLRLKELKKDFPDCWLLKP